MDEKLKNLAKGRTGKNIIDVLNDLQAKVADIRTPMMVKEHQNEIRLAVIQVIQEHLIDKLKMYSGEITPADPNEFN